MSIRTKITISFLIVGLLVGVPGSVAYSKFRDTANQVDVIRERESLVLERLTLMKSQVLERLKESIVPPSLDEPLEQAQFVGDANRFDLAIADFAATPNISEGRQEEAEALEEFIRVRLDMITSAQGIFGTIGRDEAVTESELTDFENQIDEALRLIAVFLGIENREIAEAQQEIQGTIENAQRLIVIVILVAIVMAIGLGFLLSGSILSSINRLKDATVEIGGGNLGARAAVNSGDEIGDLAIAFNQMAAARQLAEDERDSLIEARDAEIDLADQVARIVTSNLDISQVFGEFASEVRNLVDFDLAAVNVVSRDSRSLIGASLVWSGTMDTEPNMSIDLEGTQTEHVMLTGETIIHDDLRELPGFTTDRFFNDRGLRSTIVTPLAYKDRMIGSMSLASRRPAAFGPRGQAILERLAGQIAPAIENARLYHEAQEQTQEIQRLNEATNRILDSNPAALLVLRGRDREVVTINSSCCDAFGMEKGQIEGQPLSQILDWVGLEESIRESLSSPSGEEAKVMKYPGSNKTERWYMLSAVPLLMEDDTASEDEILLVLNDVTEQRQQQERLLEHSRLASVGELAAGVAHEINNPLAAIHGLSELLQTENWPDQVSEDARKIQEAAERAAKIVQNLLSFARKSEPEKRYLDVGSIVDQALELKAHDFELENIHVGIHHSERAPLTMLDEHQMVQVLLNLFTNAEQAIKDRGGPGEITVTIRLLEDTVRISVSDDGPGIREEHLRSIFDPFFSTKEVGGGTGLGLSICYGIVREHGGEMWVESEEGFGATFHVELPVLPNVTPVLTQSPNADGVRVAGRRILVVDDETQIRNILFRLLSADGHEVALAPDGEVAWKLMQENKFDNILLDLRMPGVGGQDLFRLIAESFPDLSKKVVFITGDAANADTRSFLDSIASPALSKPFTIEAIRQLL